MSDNKHYYYIKLKADYFDSDEMIVLESMPDGHKYSNILLKFMLRSLKNEGKLMFNNKIPFNPIMLSQVTRHSVGEIEKAVQIFESLNLIEILDNGAIYINDIQNFIGKSSTEADRKRSYRHRINEDKKLLGHLSEECPEINPPELELELKLKKELKLENKENKFKSLMEFKTFCVEKYKGKILTNCCPTLLLGNRLKINEKGYLESYFKGKKIDINSEKAQELWKILFENQEVIGVIKDDSIQKFIGKYIKVESEHKLTKKIEEITYQIHDYKEEENKYRLHFKDVLTKQIGKSNKLYELEDIEKLPFINKEDIQNDK
ncbi:phage replisome organizer N-terminal domain-containing protein [Aliarcobacter butzleri]|uniref:phage replisome organizer N-terminal domain-containing protein n=1 Tax=Aliarcobacter butzleri TaxID=28197 RepID=UPI001EDBCC60|nr:phage replisome organizer N-terminal domain-containing protein [Aliarcobacter butzleri]MCG3706300.1 phage replisome organizer N-terminal domain-containing protein [Aliarcobacter butzleri]